MELCCLGQTSQKILWLQGVDVQDITWESVIIPLSSEFIEYLKEDGLVLPDDSNHLESSNNERNDEVDDDWDDSNCGYEAPSFPELDNQIRIAISKFDAVFPKLNWSSAKDAAWISLNNSMKCTQPNDIYLLLKSSEFITHDLTQPFKDCIFEDNKKIPEISYELILRRWIDVNPAMEFRCFVKDNTLVGISQRDISNLYPYLSKETDEIVQDILHFFKTKIRNRFLDDKFVFDVYRSSIHDIILIDFNPFGKTTDALLFDWDFLLTLSRDDNEIPEFRCITDSVGVQPNPYQHYSIPKDFVDLGSGLDALKLIDLLKLSTEANDSLNATTNYSSAT